MKTWAGRALGLLTWLAVVWTIYEEQHHLMLYLGDPEIAFGLGEYIDIAVTATLLLYAIYEVFHAIHATRALQHYLADHPAIDALTVWLVIALGWGVYRDLSHFHHLYLGGNLPLGDEFDLAAAALLVLGVVKTGYHGWHAVQALMRLNRR
jgi:hypothetical protein